MKMRAVIVAVATVAMVQAGLVLVSGQEKTTWDGVYTKAQADTGAALYKAQCSNCHGDSAAGADAPPLNDAGFAGSWDGLVLDELVKRIKISMPANAPDTLSRQESIDITAYLLQQNRFPVGEATLAGDNVGMIKYATNKP